VHALQQAPAEPTAGRSAPGAPLVALWLAGNIFNDRPGS